MIIEWGRKALRLKENQEITSAQIQKLLRKYACGHIWTHMQGNGKDLDIIHESTYITVEGVYKLAQKPCHGMVRLSTGRRKDDWTLPWKFTQQVHWELLTPETRARVFTQITPRTDTQAMEEGAALIETKGFDIHAEWPAGPWDDKDVTDFITNQAYLLVLPQPALVALLVHYHFEIAQARLYPGLVNPSSSYTARRGRMLLGPCGRRRCPRSPHRRAGARYVLRVHP
jgi:hypothetical protein